MTVIQTMILLLVLYLITKGHACSKTYFMARFQNVTVYSKSSDMCMLFQILVLWDVIAGKEQWSANCEGMSFKNGQSSMTWVVIMKRYLAFDQSEQRIVEIHFQRLIWSGTLQHDCYSYLVRPYKRKGLSQKLLCFAIFFKKNHRNLAMM